MDEQRAKSIEERIYIQKTFFSCKVRSFNMLTQRNVRDRV